MLFLSSFKMNKHIFDFCVGHVLPSLLSTGCAASQCQCQLFGQSAATHGHPPSGAEPLTFQQWAERASIQTGTRQEGASAWHSALDSSSQVSLALSPKSALFPQSFFTDSSVPVFSVSTAYFYMKSVLSSRMNSSRVTPLGCIGLWGIMMLWGASLAERLAQSPSRVLHCKVKQKVTTPRQWSFTMR